MPTKVNIKERLLQRFSIIKDNQGNTPHAIEKISEVLANELHQLNVEQEQSGQRILKKLQEKLDPQKSARKKPAHRIIQKEWEFGGKNVLSNEEHFDFTDENGITNFWTPLYNTNLVPTEIAYRFWNGEFWRQGKSTKADWFLKSDTPMNKPVNELWLGINLLEEVALSDNAFLYIHSDQKIQDYHTSQLLDKVKVFVNDQEMETAVSLLEDQLPASTIEDWKEKQWLLHEVEEPIAKKYSNCFVKINDFNKLNNGNTSALTIQVLPPDSKEKVFWFKLVFPIALTKEDVEALEIGFNCFPALNRKLVSKEETATLPITTIPLSLDEKIHPTNGQSTSFLGLQKVFYGTGAVMKPAIVNDFGEAHAGEYGLQQGGVVEMNAAEARRQVNNVFVLLGKEKAALQNVFGQQMNNSTIKSQFENITNSLDQLRSQMNVEGSSEEQWYLHCKPLGERENVMVRFWVGGDYYI